MTHTWLEWNSIWPYWNSVNPKVILRCRTCGTRRTQNLTPEHVRVARKNLYLTRRKPEKNRGRWGGVGGGGWTWWPLLMAFDIWLGEFERSTGEPASVVRCQTQLGIFSGNFANSTNILCAVIPLCMTSQHGQPTVRESVHPGESQLSSDPGSIWCWLCPDS